MEDQIEALISGAFTGHALQPDAIADEDVIEARVNFFGELCVQR